MAPNQAKLRCRRSPEMKAHHSPTEMKATGSERRKPESCIHHRELVPSAARTTQGATMGNPKSDGRKCPGDRSLGEGLQVKVSVAQSLAAALRDHQHRKLVERENTINLSTSQQPHRTPSGQDSVWDASLRDILSGQTGNLHVKMLREKAHPSYTQALGLIEISVRSEQALENLPSNDKVGETDGDEAGEDQSPNQDHSPDAITPRPVSVGRHGAPRAINSESAGEDEVAFVGKVDNVGAVPAVASIAPLAPWIGKRRRTPGQEVTSRLKWGAVQALQLLVDSRR